MNVYDFDGTIYNGDSSVDFFLYAIRRKPSVLRYVPKQIAGFVLYGIKKIDKTELKKYFFSFLRGVDGEALSKEFWTSNYDKIFDWYLKQQAEDDIIISASPDFLLKPICEQLGIRHLIASKVDPKTGMFASENCRGAEKVNRLREKYGVTHIENFYSNSLSDLPLAELADNAFLIKNGVVMEWRNATSCENQ